MLAGEEAVTSLTKLALLSLTTITRYARPNTVWRPAEKLTLPEIVGSLWNFTMMLASFAPLVLPPALATAAAMPWIAAAPPRKPPVCAAWPAAFILASNARTAADGLSVTTTADRQPFVL